VAASGERSISTTTSAGARETIGQRLRRLRLERGLSQRDLAEPGVSYAYISRIEADARRPSLKALRILARSLRVSPEYLETGLELRDLDDRELRLAEAELDLQLGEELDRPAELFAAVLEEATSAGDRSGAVRALVGLGLVADAWLPDQVVVERERRRRARADRNRAGEALLGFGTLCMAAAFLGRDTWRYETLAVIIGAVLLIAGAALNFRFVRELVAFRGPARRDPTVDRKPGMPETTPPERRLRPR
jgi:transcriptional regulator with XRE-family HTH domain